MIVVGMYYNNDYVNRTNIFDVSLLWHNDSFRCCIHANHSYRLFDWCNAFEDISVWEDNERGLIVKKNIEFLNIAQCLLNQRYLQTHHTNRKADCYDWRGCNSGSHNFRAGVRRKCWSSTNLHWKLAEKGQEKSQLLTHTHTHTRELSNIPKIERRLVVGFCTIHRLWCAVCPVKSYGTLCLCMSLLTLAMVISLPQPIGVSVIRYKETNERSGD